MLEITKCKLTTWSHRYTVTLINSTSYSIGYETSVVPSNVLSVSELQSGCCGVGFSWSKTYSAYCCTISPPGDISL